MRSDNRLYTPEMDQAERELDARIDYALGVAHEVREQVDALEEKVRDQDPPSDEDVERIKNYVLGHAMTDEWKRVVDLINRGELTWRQVVEGLATGNLDSRVAAAFESLSKVPPASMEELVESGVFPREVIAEMTAEKEADDEPEAPGGQADVAANGAADQDEESFFEDPLGRSNK